MAVKRPTKIGFGRGGAKRGKRGLPGMRGLKGGGRRY